MARGWTSNGRPSSQHGAGDDDDVGLELLDAAESERSRVLGGVQNVEQVLQNHGRAIYTQQRLHVFGAAIGVVLLCTILVAAPLRQDLRASRPLHTVSGVEEQGLREELTARAGRAGGQPLMLFQTLQRKNQQSLTSPQSCLGFEVCPEYPKPYGWGEWPTTYEAGGRRHNDKFPEGFVWGLGTASYQIEGAYREGGRGASIWDTFTGANTIGMPGAKCSYCCKKTPCPINKAMYATGATGNIADDHYHQYPTDIALMKSMGLKNYRFSIAWPRIVPTGFVKDGVSYEGIGFYNKLIDALLEAGITPYVTLYHWDLPQGLLDPPRRQGWYSRNDKGEPMGEVTPHFVEYADLCFHHFGDRVKIWLTFNEAWTFTYLASGFGKAPSLEEYSDMRVDPYIAGHNVLNAHAAVVHLYRTKYQKKQAGKIGITNNCDWREPLTTSNADIAAAERLVEFQLGWFSDPIFGEHGDYPPVMRELYGDRLPRFTPEQSKLIKGSADFYGLNHYGTGFAFVSAQPGDDTAYAKVQETGPPGFSDLVEPAQSVWEFGAGWGFRKIMTWVKKRYNNPPLFVTEAGWSIAASNFKDGDMDHMRVLYYANYTSEMLKAIDEDGVDVKGFFAWSLMDNFEWERGYVERFGTTFNDFNLQPDPNSPRPDTAQPAPNQTRTRKESSCWLEAVWTGNGWVDPAKFAGCAKTSNFAGRYRVQGSSDTREISVGDNGMSGEVRGKNCAPVLAHFSSTTIRAALSNDVNSGFWSSQEGAILWDNGQKWTKL